MRRRHYRTFRHTKNRLRLLRLIRRWSQEDVAFKLGYRSKFRYWQIENDQIRATKRERTKLAKIFRVSEVEIFPFELAA
jgi:transcriptional regulator with XRE-family HTH domain